MPDQNHEASIRQLQGYAALFSCLPADGKAREFLSLALELDEGPALEKFGAPSKGGGDDSMREWLESLWAEDGLTADEKRLVDWQNDADNMAAAVAELEAVTSKLGSA